MDRYCICVRATKMGVWNNYFSVPGVVQKSSCKFLVHLVTHFPSTEVPLCRFKLGSIFLYIHLYHNPPLVSPSTSKKRRHEYADSLHM